MAAMQSMPPDDGAGDPSEQSEGPDKITVCIEIDTDGTISVGMQPPDDDGSDFSASAAGASGMTDLSQPSGGADDDSYMKPVPSIKAALQVAGDMLRNAAQMGGMAGPMMSKPGGAGEQDAAAAAFKSNRGSKAGY